MGHTRPDLLLRVASTPADHFRVSISAQKGLKQSTMPGLEESMAELFKSVDDIGEGAKQAMATHGAPAALNNRFAFEAVFEVPTGNKLTAAAGAATATATSAAASPAAWLVSGSAADISMSAFTNASRVFLS